MRLGHGIIKKSFASHVDIVNEDFFWNAIIRFGIEKQELEKVKPSYDDLFEIYSELKNFGFSTKYNLNKQKLQSK